MKRELTFTSIASMFVVLLFLLLILCSRYFAARSGSVPGDLALCAGVPCFRGITPGLTSWPDALAALGGRSIVTEDPAYAEIALIPPDRGDTVVSILLNRPLDPSITTGTIVATYGLPMCVTIYWKSGTILLHYPQLHILANISGSYISPFAHVGSIVLGESFQGAAPASPPCNVTYAQAVEDQISERPWQGFGAIYSASSGS